MPSSQLDRRTGYKSYANTLRYLYQRPIAKVSGAALLTLGTIIFFGLAAIRPTLVTVTELSAQLEKKRELKERADAKIQTLQQLQETLALNRETLTVFDRVVPASHQITSVLAFLEQTADQTGVRLESVRVSGLPLVGNVEAANAKVTSQVLSVSAKGDYQRLQSYVDALNQSVRLFTFESISLGTSGETEAVEGELTLSFQISVYWHP